MGGFELRDRLGVARKYVERYGGALLDHGPLQVAGEEEAFGVLGAKVARGFHHFAQRVEVGGQRGHEHQQYR